jgi:hypothetical protein
MARGRLRSGKTDAAHRPGGPVRGGRRPSGEKGSRLVAGLTGRAKKGRWAKFGGWAKFVLTMDFGI